MTRAVARNLGIPLAEENAEGSSISLSFLGIKLYTLLLTARLPQEKVSALQDLVSWSTKRVRLRRNLESLIGHLHHAAKVVYPGRPFLRCRVTCSAAHAPRLASSASIVIREPTWLGGLPLFATATALASSRHLAGLTCPICRSRRTPLAP